MSPDGSREFRTAIMPGAMSANSTQLPLGLLRLLFLHVTPHNGALFVTCGISRTFPRAPAGGRRQSGQTPQTEVARGYAIASVLAYVHDASSQQPVWHSGEPHAVLHRARSACPKRSRTRRARSQRVIPAA